MVWKRVVRKYKGSNENNEVEAEPVYPQRNISGNQKSPLVEMIESKGFAINVMNYKPKRLSVKNLVKAVRYVIPFVSSVNGRKRSYDEMMNEIHTIMSGLDKCKCIGHNYGFLAERQFIESVGKVMRAYPKVGYEEIFKNMKKYAEKISTPTGVVLRSSE
jgi:hypothetical protein